MYSLLSDPQVSRELGFGTLVFCNKTLNEFIAYLKNIIESASPKQMAAVREVYDDKAGESFVTMYEKG